mgnify:CR=1 FL=1
MQPNYQKSVQMLKPNPVKLFIFIAAMFVWVFGGKRVSAQDPLFSQFYANPLYLNPALAGAEGCGRLVFNYRNQPFPAFGTFSTYSVSADQYFSSVSGGLGILAMHDNQGGLLNTTQVGVVYAYQTQLTRTWYANFGIQANYINHYLNWDELIFADQFNPAGPALPAQELPPGQLSDHLPDLAAGVVIYNGRFYGGLAAHHLNQAGSSLFPDEKLPLKLTLHLGYEFSAKPARTSHATQEGVSFSPNLIIQSQSDYYRINYGFYTHLNPLVAGIWFRHGVKHPNSLIFLLGIKQVNYAIGYSYDHSLSGFSATGRGAHEIGVLLNFNCAAPNMKYRILNCPSF